MNTLSINAGQVDFADSLATPAPAGPVELLPGFIHHLQRARQVEQEARQLYAPSEVDPADRGIANEDISARLARPYPR